MSSRNNRKLLGLININLENGRTMDKGDSTEECDSNLPLIFQCDGGGENLATQQPSGKKTHNGLCLL